MAFKFNPLTGNFDLVDLSGAVALAQVDDLVDLSGMPVNSTDLDTFTGTTIPDDSTIKEALQALETGLEAHESDTTDAHDASAISNVPSGNLAATDVQGALNELQSNVDNKEDIGVAAELASRVGKLLYIDKTRSDTYTESGSFIFPYKTIQAAIDYASSVGDGTGTPYSFILSSGTYEEEVDLNNKILAFISFEALGRVAINPTMGNALTSNASNSILQDLVVRGIEFGRPVVLTGDGTVNQFKTTEFHDCSFSGNGTITLNRLNNFELVDVYSENTFTATNVNFMFFNGGQIQGTFTYTMDSALPQPANGVIGGINILSMMMNGVSLTVGGTAIMNFAPHSSRIGTTAGSFTIPTGCTFTAYNSLLRGNWTNNGILHLRNSHSENDISGTAPIITANKSSQTSYIPTAPADYSNTHTRVDTALDELASRITDHIADITDAHAASAISNTPAGTIAATDIQSAINELDGDVVAAAGAAAAAQQDIDDHIADAIDAHDASAISSIPAGNLAATEVQAALNELQSDIDTRALNSDLNAHLTDTTDAHDASAISNIPTGNLVATDVQSALDELQTNIDDVQTDVNDLVTLSGVAANSTTLGTFTGTIIADSSTIKAALQALETEVEGIPSPFYYAGVWAASTNTPTLDNTDVGVTGAVYYVTDSGTVDFGAGAQVFNAGDKVANNGITWDKWDMTDGVVTVNGQTGVVVLDTDDITEGTAIYFTDERAQDAVGTILADTDTINLSYTDATPSITADVITQLSITSDASGIKLVNDAATPGNNYYYGTNSSGVKGYQLITAPASTGDVPEMSFSAANNQAAPADVTGFLFATASVRSFRALVSVSIDATADLFEEFTLNGINKGVSWNMSIESVGDVSGITFSITSAGQVQYTSSNEAGFVSSTFKFRAITTTV